MQSVQYAKQDTKNRNLTLHYDDDYQGQTVLARPDQPLITQYLDRINDTIDEALYHHHRITAFWFVLKLPFGYPLGDTDNSLMTSFWKSVKSKIEADRIRARRHNSRVHETGVFYVWAREYNATETAPHWHCALMVNQDTYYTMGSMQSNQDNMWSRINSAWASALGLYVNQIDGLVELLDNETYYLDQNSMGDKRKNLFKRLSYLAKSPTKVYQDGIHAFGCSRARRPGSSSRW
ncbi:inovirus Gp2 family protein [uncultured Halovibrio sp.]|uniref:inovirus Gp2 family protein n=1 Tax=uncultured Halovibrio sp. TaxID=985049 RepID=UPI0025FE9279|nr:inovirus Gp2 family protein [uncultured Halovibrio sp.]